MDLCDIHTVVIGASAAGLAVSCCLKKADIPFVLLEQQDCIAAPWRNHYDRLRLHTSKGLSALPHLPFPAHYPRYPTRSQVLDYLESYAATFELHPRFGQRVACVRTGDGGWETHTQQLRLRSQNVVIATGYARKPYMPSWRGLTDFAGDVIHSSRYRSGRRFRGRRVLVVGFGNSGGEIALDLCEHGASTSISVRGPVHVVPRDLLGLPILAWGIALDKLPSKLADRLSVPLLRWSIGDLRRYGLKRPSYGPITQIRRYGRVPLLDVGTVGLIKQGRITLRPGIEQFTTDGIVFEDQRREPFDAVILATGYRPGLDEFLQASVAVTDPAGIPVVSGGVSAIRGLYFCGFHVSATGMLREIAMEAQRISRHIQSALYRALPSTI